MSTDVAKTLPIGAVRAYWNGVRLGSPMTQAAIKYTREAVAYGLEDAGVEVGSHPTKEVMEVNLVIADFKAHQMRYAYAGAASKYSSSTLKSAQYSSALATFEHYFREDVFLTGTVAVTVTQAKFKTATVKIFKSDYSNTPDGYTRGTDWTGTSSNGHIKRRPSGSITTGQTVIVEYVASATSAVVYTGGNMADFEAELVLEHQTDNGKHMAFRFYRAKKMGASDVAIQMAAQFGGVPFTFKILADMTKAPGKQLMELGVEA